MPQTMYYCDLCGRRITPGEIAESDALVSGMAAVCSECVGQLTPEERDLLGGGADQGASASSAANFAAKPARRGGRATGTKRTAIVRTIARARRRRASKRIGAVVAVVVCLVGIVVFMNLLNGSDNGGGSSPGRRRQPGVSGRSTSDVPEAAPTGGSRSPAARPSPTDAPATGDPLAERFASAEKLMEKLPDTFTKVIEVLEAIRRDHPGTPGARRAADLIERIGMRFATIADEAFHAARAKALESAGRGDHEGALKAFAALRERFAGSGWLERSGEARIAAALRDMVKARADGVRKAIARASKALESNEYESARRELALRKQWPEDMRRKADQLLSRIEDLEARNAEEVRRSETWEAFLVELHAKMPQGLAATGRFAEDSSTHLRKVGLSDRLARVQQVLKKAGSVERSALAALAASGEKVRLAWRGQRIGGTVLGVKREVVSIRTHKGHVVDIPSSGFDPEKLMVSAAVGAPEAATFLLLRGRIEAAREKLAGQRGERAEELLKLADELSAALPEGVRGARDGAAETAADRGESRLLRKLFNGNVVKWDRATHRIELHYDFRDAAQLDDWETLLTGAATDVPRWQAGAVVLSAPSRGAASMALSATFDGSKPFKFRVSARVVAAGDGGPELGAEGVRSGKRTGVHLGATPRFAESVEFGTHWRRGASGFLSIAGDGKSIWCTAGVARAEPLPKDVGLCRPYAGAVASHIAFDEFTVAGVLDRSWLAGALKRLRQNEAGR